MGTMSTDTDNNDTDSNNISVTPVAVYDTSSCSSTQEITVKGWQIH